MEPLYPIKRRGRIWELDFLRGLAVALMIFDHIAYDFSELKSYFANWYSAGEIWHALQKWGTDFYMSDLRTGGHYAFAGLFFLLAGVSCALSSSNFRRGLQLAGLALCVTLASYGATMVTGVDMLIVFGVLHCMALGILLCALVEHCCKDKIWLLIVGSLLILGGILIPWYDMEYITELNGHYLEVILGFHKFGADYFAFLPCGGVVLVGAYIGKSFYSERKSLLPRLDGRWNLPVCVLGRNTLAIYILHQVVILGAILLAGVLDGLTFAF